MSDSYVLSLDQRNPALDPSIPPALEIDPGAVVTFETGDDAYVRLAAGEPVEEIGLENFNSSPGRSRCTVPSRATRCVSRCSP